MKALHWSCNIGWLVSSLSEHCQINGIFKSLKNKLDNSSHGL